MNKTVSIIITIAIVVGIGTLIFSQSKSSTDTKSVQNIEMREGVQYVTILAKEGYSPSVTNAASNIPTKLIIKTSGTYDCSSALIIRSIDYRKTLSQTGEEVIDLGTPQTGTLQGLCSMGMYNFSINFK